MTLMYYLWTILSIHFFVVYNYLFHTYFNVYLIFRSHTPDCSHTSISSPLPASMVRVVTPVPVVTVVSSKTVPASASPMPAVVTGIAGRVSSSGEDDKSNASLTLNNVQSEQELNTSALYMDNSHLQEKQQQLQQQQRRIEEEKRHLAEQQRQLIRQAEQQRQLVVQAEKQRHLAEHQRQIALVEQQRQLEEQRHIEEQRQMEEQRQLVFIQEQQMQLHEESHMMLRIQEQQRIQIQEDQKKIEEQKQQLKLQTMLHTHNQTHMTPSQKSISHQSYVTPYQYAIQAPYVTNNGYVPVYGQTHGGSAGGNYTGYTTPDYSRYSVVSTEEPHLPTYQQAKTQLAVDNANEVYQNGQHARENLALQQQQQAGHGSLHEPVFSTPVAQYHDPTVMSYLQNNSIDEPVFEAPKHYRTNDYVNDFVSRPASIATTSALNAYDHMRIQQRPHSVAINPSSTQQFIFDPYLTHQSVEASAALSGNSSALPAYHQTAAAVHAIPPIPNLANLSGGGLSVASSSPVSSMHIQRRRHSIEQVRIDIYKSRYANHPISIYFTFHTHCFFCRRAHTGALLHPDRNLANNVGRLVPSNLMT